MARVNQKTTKEKLQRWAVLQGKITSLETQRIAALQPAREKFEKAAAKVDAEFGDEIADTRKIIAELDRDIRGEVQKGFDAKTEIFAKTKIETDDALVEVNTRETREIDAQEWIESIPKSQRSGQFFDTLKVLIGKAEDFRSDIVAKLSKPNRTHSISIRLK